MNSKDDKNDSKSRMINLKTMLGKTAGICKKSVYTADESNIEKKIKDAVKKILPFMVLCRIQISILSITEIGDKTQKLHSLVKKTNFVEEISAV